MARTYVVTGAASGIGAATAKQLREAGQVVIGVDLQGTDIDADLSNEAGRKAMAEAVSEKTGGKIDAIVAVAGVRSEEHTSELQSRGHLVCRLLLEKKNTHGTETRTQQKS